MSEPARAPALRATLRVAVSAVVLWLVFRWVDAGGVVERLADLRPGWLLLALAVTVLQVLVLAWRWRFTATRLGIDLPLRAAVAEYYLGILINQLLPGGVAGDVSRAWRHARSAVSAGPAVRAVVLERASAQVLMTLTALASVLMLPWASPWVRGAAALVALLTLTVIVTWLARPGAAAPTSVLGRLRTDAHRAVLTPGALVPQLSSAMVVVLSYILVFYIAGRAVGMDATAGTVLPLVAPVLMTMLIPVSVGGWGVREAAAAALWGLAGMTPEDGAAVSVTYGLVVLASAAPGLVVLIRSALGGPGRRGRRPPV